MSPISKTFTNNSWDNLLDFAIYGWFKIQQITNIWGVGFHFTSTPKNVWDDKNKFGDRLLTLFVLGNTLENHTYTLYSQGSQSASPNIWLDTVFTQDDLNKWAFIYVSVGSAEQAHYVFYKLPSSNPQPQKSSQIITHQTSNTYTIFVGYTLPNYASFPGQVCGLYILAGKGAYRESGFEQFYGLQPSDAQSCGFCQVGYYLQSYNCYQWCPNNYKLNIVQKTCDQCTVYTSDCQTCSTTCRSCQFGNKNICLDCYETMQISNQTCVCKNGIDNRNIFYQCSNDNVAVLQANLASDNPTLTINFGVNLKKDNFDCSQIFQPNTLAQLGSTSTCTVSQTNITIALSQDANITETQQISIQPNILQYDKNSNFINTFYLLSFSQLRNQPFQMNYKYDELQNTCNDIIFKLIPQNDAMRGFNQIIWSIQAQPTLDSQTQQQVNNIVQTANNNINPNLIFPKYLIPPDTNVTATVQYFMKININGTLSFSTLYQKYKQIVIQTNQSPQAPIYRYMDLSFQFQLYIQICDQSGSVQLFEPYDIQINSITLPSLSQNYKQTTQQIFSVSVKKYQIPFSTNFDLQRLDRKFLDQQSQRISPLIDSDQNLINTQNNVEVNNSKKDEKSTNRDENIALNQKKQQYLYQQQNFDSIQQINNNLKIEQKHSYELPYITSNINKDIEQQKSSQENNQDALQDDKQLQLIDLDQYIQKENLQQNIDKVQKEQQQNIQPDQKEKLEQQIDSLSSQSNQLQQQYELQLQQLQNQLGTLETTTKLAAQTFLSLNIQQNNYYTTQNNIQLIDHRQGSLISNFQINNNEINQKQQFLKDSQNLQSNNDVLNEQNQQKDKNQIQQKSNLDQSSQKNNQEVQKEDSIYLKVVNDNLLKLSKKLFFSIILVTGVTIITLIHKIKIIGKKISALFLISLLLFYYYVILSIISGQEASQANSQTLSFLLIAGIDFIGILTLMSVLKLSLAQYSNQGQRKNKKDQQQFNEQEGQGKYTGKDTAEQRNLDHEFKAIQDINQDKEDPFKQNQFFQKSESKELKQIQKKQDVDLKQAERTSCQREEESNKCYNKQGNNNYNQTENDHILAQLLFQEINQGPLCQKRNDQQFYEYERQKSTKENQFRNAEVSLTEKEKNFLKKQQQELEMFNKQKEQNKDEFDLVEVNEEFINNIFNKQYPNNQQILDKINKEKQQKNENPALELQRRSQKQILEQQKYQQQQIQKQQLQQKQKQLQQQSLTNYVSPNEKRSNQASQKSDFQNLLKEVEGVQYCNLCGEYQRQSLMESHNNKCRMSYVQCEFCNRQFPRYSISDHTVDCLRKEEFKLLDLYQRTFAQDGLQVNRTHQIFFGSRDYMRQQFNQQTFEQQKEIEKLIVQNQKKIKKSYQNNVSRSEYYADVKYVKDPQSSQAEDCCICFVTFIEKETLGMLPCAHKFHTNCIDSWIKVKKLCPLCKRTF
ncbi:hypothetical protein ABPG74_008203 [Tetrahymena malaccensis]